MMAEIKSTLDIIMEKTKDLTMTEGEKEAIRKTEIEGKVRGLLRKFIDGLIKPERIRKEIASLGPEQQLMANEALTKECLGRMEPGGGNEKFLEALEYVTGADTKPLRQILSEFQEKKEKERRAREGVIRERLHQAGISGTAVIPNISADSEWTRYLSEIRGELKEKLDLQRKNLAHQH